MNAPETRENYPKEMLTPRLMYARNDRTTDQLVQIAQLPFFARCPQFPLMPSMPI